MDEDCLPPGFYGRLYREIRLYDAAYSGAAIQHPAACALLNVFIQWVTDNIVSIKTIHLFFTMGNNPD